MIQLISRLEKIRLDLLKSIHLVAGLSGFQQLNSLGIQLSDPK